MQPWGTSFGSAFRGTLPLKSASGTQVDKNTIMDYVLLEY
jgi:hypothetical protein